MPATFSVIKIGCTYIYFAYIILSVYFKPS